MPTNVNVTYSNFNPGTGPGNASFDVTVNWVDDAGTPHSDNRVGVTLPTLWNLITAAQRKVVFQATAYWMVRMVLGLDE